MFNKVKEFFNIKQKGCDNDSDSDYEDIINSMENEGVDEVDYSKFPQPLILNNNSSKSLLILDDLPSSWLLYDDYFRAIEAKTSNTPLKDFNIIKCIGAEAGFIANKYLMENSIDYAILDLTLGFSLHIKGGGYEELDGIDIAFKILEKNPNAKIIFSTAHRLNKENPILTPYFNKFENATGLNLIDYYINKNDNILENLNDLLYFNGERYEIKYS